MSGDGERARVPRELAVLPRVHVRAGGGRTGALHVSAKYVMCLHCRTPR